MIGARTLFSVRSKREKYISKIVIFLRKKTEEKKRNNKQSIFGFFLLNCLHLAHIFAFYQ